MARKGDAAKTVRKMDEEGGRAGNTLDNTRADLKPQNQQLQNRYNVAADRSGQDYNQMMSDYDNLIGSTKTAFGPSRQGYQDFANTGGYGDQDIQDIRARAIAPTRSVFASAQAGIDRQRALQGYSPNYTAATAKLARDRAASASDANVNANASIADSIRQGKLAGLAGLNQTEIAQISALLGINSGKGNLYSATPGQTSMYGNQLGQSNSQMLDLQQLENQLRLGLIDAKIRSTGIPSNYQQGLGNVSGTLGVVGQAMTLGTLGGKSGFQG